MRTLRILLVLMGSIASAGVTQKICAATIENDTNQIVTIRYLYHQFKLVTPALQPHEIYDAYGKHITARQAKWLADGKEGPQCTLANYCTTTVWGKLTYKVSKAGASCNFTCT